MLKITRRGKESARRCAYLSSISVSVFFMQPHNNRTDPARLSENIRQKQQQSECILQSHPQTDAGPAPLNVSKWGNHINIHTCDVTTHHASSSSSSIQMKELVSMAMSPLCLYTRSVPLFPTMPSFSVYNRRKKINALNTFSCYTSDCSLLLFDSENHHFCFPAHKSLLCDDKLAHLTSIFVDVSCLVSIIISFWWLSFFLSFLVI